ncbi:MFS transporter [Saccharomonospora iraqiensis]|uniref:MFS transporter n=1 Tax=Saccharomonospora iraqiensis TaxID=52698 RepID=UPI00022E6E71|nr:MFS transporter [Saccharomonospora iraqiensis]
MALKSYLPVLRIPGVTTSMLLMFAARLPMTATGITLTLHVVGDLGRGYGAAGLVGTATMAGTALAAPLLGRMIDRHGLRPVLAVCGTVSGVFWTAAGHLPYGVLLVAALPAGALVVPAGSVARQVLTALVPERQRRTAFSLDMMSLELTYMTGPVAAIALTTQVSSTATLTVIGLAFAAPAAVLMWLDPPVRTPEESGPGTGARPALRTWVRRPLVATLLVAMGALFVLVGTELATVAALRESGEVAWTGVVIAVMCAASLAGGLVHGAVSRSLPQPVLMVALAVLVLPVGLVSGPWWVLALALIPSNLACAPTLAATTESVSRLVPHTVRGEAMGVQDSATRMGLALGSPVVGWVLDHAGPAWGFAASGLGGLTLAAVGGLLLVPGRPRPGRRRLRSTPAGAGRAVSGSAATTG